jgi:hypothetical protein
MLETTFFEEITQIKMSRVIGVAEIVRRLFGGEHHFAQLTNGQYRTENLIRSVLKMRGSR